MAYGTANVDTIQSSTAGTPPQFNDGNGTQVGTLCRAWVNFAGASGTRNNSFNVSSVTRNTTGRYIINFTNALPNSTYATISTAYEGATNGVIAMISTTSGSTYYSTTQVGIAVNGATGSFYDPTAVMVAVFD